MDDDLKINSTILNEEKTTTSMPVINLEKLKCDLLKNSTEILNNSRNFCNVMWDGLLCWPKTVINKNSTIQCFKELNGIKYINSNYATRLCLSNATWAEKADYGKCTEEPDSIPEENIVKNLSNIKETSKIFFIGYGLSLIALIFALLIFLYFKELKCMRNRIHTNLIITYILMVILWFTNFQNSALSEHLQCYSFMLLNYFLTTSYFWMFVEGLYLYLLVIQTFSVEKIPLIFYIFLGWGLPAIFMLIWIPFKYLYSKTDDVVRCPWVERDSLDYIFVVPILIVLLLNIFFMCVIIYVLITKLKISNSAESQQYRKATKAMLVLIPLLGANYWFLIVPPKEQTARIIILNLRAVLYSTQGLVVAVLYCFLNGEVKNCIRTHLKRWKSLRSLYSKKHPKRSNTTNKGSASSGSTLLNSSVIIETNDTNDYKTSLLKSGQKMQNFNKKQILVFNKKSSVEILNNSSQVGLLTPQ